MTAAAEILLYQDDIHRLDEIKAYINGNYSRKISTAAIADKFAISKSRLHRHFISIHKESVADYIMRVRMVKAMECLKARQIPVNQIAEAVGYSDRTSFTRAFTKFFGQPPTDFIR